MAFGCHLAWADDSGGAQEKSGIIYECGGAPKGGAVAGGCGVAPTYGCHLAQSSRKYKVTIVTESANQNNLNNRKFCKFFNT